MTTNFEPGNNSDLQLMNKVLSSVLYVLTIPPMTITTILYIKRHHFHPLRAFSYPLSITLALLCVLYVAIQNLFPAITDKFPCALQLWMTGLLLPVIPFIVTIKSFVLLFQFEISKNLLELRIHPRAQHGFYLTHRHWLTNSFLVKLTAIYTTVLFLGLLAINILEPDFHTSDYCIYHFDRPLVNFYFTFFRQIVLFLFIPPVLWVAIRLTKFGSDGQNLKIQLKICAIGSLVGIAFATFIVPMFTPVTYDYVFPAHIGTVTMAVFVYTPNIAYPLYLSYIQERMEKAVMDKLSDFNQILMNQAGFNTFLQFVSDEFSSENLLFWDRIHSFRLVFEPLCNPTDVAAAVSPTPDKVEKEYDERSILNLQSPVHTAMKHHRLGTNEGSEGGDLLMAIDENDADMDKTPKGMIDEAWDIYSTHLSKHAESEVNLPSRISTKLHSFFSERIPQSSFTDMMSTEFSLLNEKHKDTLKELMQLMIEAQEEIFKLMQSDSFKRFRVSPLFVDLQSQVVDMSKSNPDAFSQNQRSSKHNNNMFIKSKNSKGNSKAAAEASSIEDRMKRNNMSFKSGTDPMSPAFSKRGSYELQQADTFQLLSPSRKVAPSSPLLQEVGTNATPVYLDNG